SLRSSSSFTLAFFFSCRRRHTTSTRDWSSECALPICQSVGRADAPVLIDQEGGRVARLKPPHWPARPPAAFFGELYRQRGRTTRSEERRVGKECRARWSR